MWGTTTLYWGVQAVTVVLETDGERLDLRFAALGFGWNDGFGYLEAYGTVGVTADDDPVRGRESPSVWIRRL